MMLAFMRLTALTLALLCAHAATAERHALPPEPEQCTPFVPTVTCNAHTGGWDVTLTNTAQSTFAPGAMDITTAQPGISLVQDPQNPTQIALHGASPGDRISLMINATEHGAGGAPGLDLCCLGAIDVVIPLGEQCLPPLPDRHLDVQKACAPLAYADAFGSNTQCTFTVNYSGPPPTPNNPITLTDTLTSGGPMVVQSSWPPSGPDSLWACSQTPTNGPFTCTMDNTLDPDPTPGYWTAYTSSFSIQTTLTQPYRNCLDGMTQSASGAPVTAQSCTQSDEADLIVAKSLVPGSTCAAGQSCAFEITVTNQGTGPYSGPVTLSDTVSLGGAVPSGTLTAITPPVCSVADLNAGTCDAPLSLPAGQSSSFVIDYTAPAALSTEITAGRNCITLFDETMQPGDHPADSAGKKACVEFSLDPPTPEATLDIAKACRITEAIVGGPVTLDCSVTIAGQGLTQGDTLDFTDTMTGVPNGADQFNSPWFNGDLASYPCVHSPGVPESICAVPVSAPMQAGQPLVITGQISFEPWAFNTPMTNCAEATSRDDPALSGQACATVTVPKPGTDQPEQHEEDEGGTASENTGENTGDPVPPLTIDTLDMRVTKTSSAPCRVNRTAQTYTCEFNISVRNAGGGIFDGPIVIADEVTSEPKPARIELLTGAGWSCLTGRAGGASCVTPAARLESGQSSDFSVKMVVPGRRDGGSLTNCAAPGLPEDQVQRVKIVQQAMANAGLNVGAVDGAFGPRTRRALIALQKQLGLPQSGVIDDALFSAMGLGAAEQTQPSCVTVDLPPMPRPPEVVCAEGQRKNAAGKCFTPRKPCAEGQRRNSKGQCYTPRTTGTPVPSGPSCDGRSTVARGSECVCRYRGMRQVSASRCACRNGLPPVRGVGCVNVTIERGGDGPAGTDGGGRNCVTALGVTRCF